MLKFRVARVVPPGRRYFYEVGGVTVEALTFEDLCRKVRSIHRERGEEPPTDLGDKIQHYMCLRLPEGFCYGSPGMDKRHVVITLSDVRNKTMKLAAGNPRVTPGEARRRGEACSRCRLNDQTVCPSCVGLVSWARRLAGQSVGAMEEWLGICLVDQTAIAAKIHMREISENDQYPDNCWRALV